MNESENILNDIQRDMTMLDNEFKNVEAQLNEYTEKINQLVTRKEQIRGQYTALYNILAKYKPQALEPETPAEETECCCGDCNCSDSVEQKEDKEETVETPEVNEETSAEEKTTEVLSESDVKKVKQTLDKLDDTPDYLK